MLLQEAPEPFCGGNGTWRAAFQHPPSLLTASSAFTVRNERTNALCLVYGSETGSVEDSGAMPFLRAKPHQVSRSQLLFLRAIRAIALCPLWRYWLSEKSL